MNMKLLQGEQTLLGSYPIEKELIVTLVKPSSFPTVNILLTKSKSKLRESELAANRKDEKPKRV